MNTKSFYRCLAIVLLVNIFLGIAFSDSVYAQEGAAYCNRKRQDLELIERHNLEPGHRPIGSEIAPFDNRSLFYSLSTTQMMRSISGFYCDSLHVHPAMYAHGGGVTVVGPGYEQTFRLDQRRQAFVAYESLMSRIEFFNRR